MNTTRVQSVSIIPTTRQKCNAKCLYCVAKMTPGNIEQEEIKWVSVDRVKAILVYGKQAGAMTAIITSKSEPTLDAKADINKMAALISMAREYLPQVDVHTNGWLLSDEDLLFTMFGPCRANMVTLSIASFDPKINKELMGIEVDYKELIGKLNSLGICVRISTVCTTLNIPNAAEARKHIHAAKKYGADMVVFRQAWSPKNTQHTTISNWVENNTYDMWKMAKNLVVPDDVIEIRELPWGTFIFDIEGINVTFAQCDEKFSNVYKSIQLVPKKYPNGSIGWRIRGSWSVEGDTLG